METIEIRPINQDKELDEALDLWSNVFPKSRAFFEQRIRLDPVCSRETTWIARVNGKLAGAVQIFPLLLSYNGLVLKCGGIGNVAALPQYRGKHLIRTILKHQTMWMADHGYDLSLLFTGINSFYEKEGWHTFRVNRLLLDVDELPKIEVPNHYRIRELEERDLKQVQHVYKVFCASQVGSVVRSDEYWRGQVKWRQERNEKFLNAFDGDRLVAYLRYEVTGEGRVELVECCCLPAHEGATLSLINRIKTIGANVQSLCVPFSEQHFLQTLFNKWGARSEEYSGTMWKVVRFREFCKKIQPVLLKRSKDFGDGAILVRSGSEEVIFHFANGAEAIKTPGGSLICQSLIERKPEDFIKDVLVGTSLDHEQYALLFPRTSYGFWQSDRF
ncbi:GNAT family N-acetyltransferase [Sporolactobacillus sp. STCC-11]|uniref:GNAT family N-acetyltransferase n=1 Tax=Sporolactobacillus caesalpiniae TaxID=3230362 RepID=UPI00339AE57D